MKYGKWIVAFINNKIICKTKPVHMAANLFLIHKEVTIANTENNPPQREENIIDKIAWTNGWE